ncbi:MAG: aldo/keto reductase [Gemmatimonadota bacterium]|nr:MAG: aldo/keto reductase [Gemmatimonadota bacterium]
MALTDYLSCRNVGRSGLVVSEISLGSWLTYGAAVNDETAADCLRTALDEGIFFFDTADVYNQGAAESVLGRVLSEQTRSDLVIATKAFFPMSDNPNDRGLSRKHLTESLEKSLKRLKTDYVDLFQCHRFDPNVPMEETVRAMDDLVRSGKTLYWGVSLWNEEQIADGLRVADELGAVRPISNQPPYNMLERDVEERVIPFCEEHGLGQVVFSPLCEGILTGKYSGGKLPEGSRATSETYGRFLRPRMTERNLDVVDRLAGVAAEAGMTLPALALAWALRLSNVSAVIIGASRPEQVRENAKAAGVTLERDLLQRIEMILSGS